jgi:hypothetical protein
MLFLQPVPGFALWNNLPFLIVTHVCQSVFLPL